MTNFDIMVATVLGLCFGCSAPITTEKLNLTIPKSYLASKTQYPISIDGLANETAWNDTKWTDLFMDIQGPDLDTPYYDTRVKMLWDMDYLYIHAKMEDEHVWGDIEQRDAVIFYNNDLNSVSQ